MLERILRKVRPSGNLPVACPEGHVASSVAHRVSKHFRQSVSQSVTSTVLPLPRGGSDPPVVILI